MPRRARPSSKRRVIRRRPADRAERGAAIAIVVAGILLIAAWQVARWSAAERMPTRRTPLTPEAARIANAAIPIAPGPVPRPRPFRFQGTPAAREQAVRCLATAALYEAGDDIAGQRAIMQVILNRVRLTGYPKTVCGVVYQGAALPTGCQFSFACDGSATRRPEHAGWIAARDRARHALSGSVFRPIGTATHYHADYVLPYWLGSLRKTAVVHSHIFYRPPERRQPGTASRRNEPG